jgi:hypothetical protein
MTQTEALKTCHELYHGRLLTILSQEEDERISDLIRSQTITSSTYFLIVKFKC